MVHSDLLYYTGLGQMRFTKSWAHACFNRMNGIAGNLKDGAARVLVKLWQCQLEFPMDGRSAERGRNLPKTLAFLKEVLQTKSKKYRSLSQQLGKGTTNRGVRHR